MSAPLSSARAPAGAHRDLKQTSSVSIESFYDVLRYRLVPPAFVVVFTLAVQYLAYRANPSVPFTWDR